MEITGTSREVLFTIALDLKQHFQHAREQVSATADGGTYYMASTIRPRYIDAMELPSVSRSDLSHSRRSAQSLIGERRKVLRKWLMSGPCTVAEAASLFSMSSRPLTRHLEAEGLTFRDLTNEARFD